METEEQKVILMARAYGEEARRFASLSDEADRRKYLEVIKQWALFRVEIKEPSLQQEALDAFRAEHNR